MTSIRIHQKDDLCRMLNLNEDTEVTAATGSDIGAGAWSDSWKVLVYDRFCRDIISPLMNVQTLKTKGVTLYALLDEEREVIPEVPAVYFVQPTAENVDLIVKDCQEGRYDEMHVNFVTHLPRPLLEKLARGVVTTDSVRRVHKVYQQHLNFVSLEDDLFSLNVPDSFRLLHDPTMPDAQIEKTMTTIAHSLLDVCVSLGCVPVIRFRSGGPAEMVGRHLDTLFREHLTGSNAWFHKAMKGGSFQRPLLLLLDRTIDLASSLSHRSRYQSLVQDLLGIKSNRVVVEVTTDGRVQRRTYDLDSEADAFWRAHRGNPFPEAIAANGEELEACTKKEEEVKKRTGESTEEAEAEAALLASGMAGGLAAAVDSLPALMNRKKQLSQHTHVLQGVMKEVAARHVPSYYDVEKQIMSATADKAEVFELLRDRTKGCLGDKLRLAEIYLLHCTPGKAEAELKDLQAALVEVSGPAGEGAAAVAGREGVDEAVATLRWLCKYLQSTRAMMAVTPAAPSSSKSTGASDSWAGGLNYFFSDVAEKAAGTAVGFINKAVANVKSFLPSHDQLPVTRVTAAEMGGRTHADSATYVTLDPKVRAGSSAAPTGAGPGVGAGSGSGSSDFSRAIVFMIGGGSYSEYHNLRDYAQSGTSAKDIVYGCTQLLAPDHFQTQLAALARVAR